MATSHFDAALENEKAPGGVYNIASGVDRSVRDVARLLAKAMGRPDIEPEMLVLTATARMREARVDQLPVVDAEGKPVGLLDVQDLLAAKFV